MPPREDHEVHFSQLPPATQEFLMNLGERDRETLGELLRLEKDDVTEIKAGLGYVKSMQQLGRVARWTVMGVIATFTVIYTFGKNIAEAWTFIRGVR